MAGSSVKIDGHVEVGFEGVANAFRANFERNGDVGAACCLHVGGRNVVDIWGGTTDPASGTPYLAHTLQLVFSSTKGATATCANLLAQRGLLDLDAPVARYWPEFAQAGKAEVPLRWLLGHRVGLPALDARLTTDEALAWSPVIRLLEAQKPEWEPGTAHGYHAITFGYLVGEVVRRVDGRSIGRFLAEEIAEPLGLEFWIGLPDDQQRRVAPIIPADPFTDPAVIAMREQYMGPDSLTGRALSLSGALALPDSYNTDAVRAAEIPAANGVTNARSLSRLYAAIFGTVDGGPESFGHTGAGGSMGFADPENGVAFGYVMNKMQQVPTGDPRTRSLIRASYEAIGVPLAWTSAT